jgi:broad-specificity NMP kinase
MIIVINGSLGVGKSTVMDAVLHTFEKGVALDGDEIGYVHPFEIYDEQRITYLYRTLTHLICFHQRNGYRSFVINYVFESPESLAELLAMLGEIDDDVHAVWLTCDPDEQEARIRKRGRDSLTWELSRFVELRRIQAEAAKRGFIGVEIDTTGKSPEIIAESIKQKIGAAKTL